MHLDPNGQKILNELMIDRFLEPRDEWYDSIGQMELKIALMGKKKSEFHTLKSKLLLAVSLW